MKRLSRKKPASRRRRDIIQSLPALQEEALASGGRPGLDDGVVDLLVDYTLHKTVSMLIRNQPHIKRLVSQTVEEALVEMLSVDGRDLKERVRTLLERKLQRDPVFPEREEPGREEEGEAS